MAMFIVYAPNNLGMTTVTSSCSYIMVSLSRIGILTLPGEQDDSETEGQPRHCLHPHHHLHQAKGSPMFSDVFV